MQSVQTIYNYFKKFDYKTEVMGASFRNIGEIIELAGCDLLTISPDLLAELQKTEGTARSGSSPPRRPRHATPRASISTRRRSAGCSTRTPMATEKLADGIRRFAADLVKLEKYIAQNLNQPVQV